MIVKFSRICSKSDSISVSLSAVFLCNSILLFAGISSQQAKAADSALAVREKVVISISEGNLNLVSSPSIKALKVVFSEGTEGDYLVEKKGSQVEIRSRDQLSKSEFSKPVSAAGKKKRELEVLLPPNDEIEFHVLEGSVSVSGLSHEVLGHVLKGKMFFKDCQGANLTLHAQKAEVSVQDSQGKIFVDSYSGAVNLKNYSGDVELHNFSGESNLEKVKGFLSLALGSGVTKILSSSGSLQFELGKGVLTSQLFAGRIEGQSGEGAINVTLASENDLNLKAQAGKISVQTPQNSGALLNISTQEGEIYGPSYMRVARDGGNKTLRGRLKGETQKSSIVIRGQETVIVIK